MTKELSMQAARVGKNRKPFNYKIVPVGSPTHNFIFYIQHPRYFKPPSFFVIKNHLLEWLASIPAPHGMPSVKKITHPWTRYRDERSYPLKIHFDDHSVFELSVEYVNELPK